MLFRRERDQPMMGPDGGNGGNGGHVVVVGSKVHNTLVHLNSRQIRGGNGEIGKRHGLHGKSIQPSVIKVPLGTLIVNNNNNEVIDMITKDGQEVLVASGGFGGYGNKHFQCSTSTYPSVAVPSKELRALQETTIRLHCLAVTHVTFIGHQNAGKSSIVQFFTNCSWLGDQVRPALGTFNGPKYELNKKLGINVTFADLPNFEENPEQALRYTLFAHKNCIVINCEEEDAVEHFKSITDGLSSFALKKACLILNRELILADEVFSYRNQHFPDMEIYSFPYDLEKFEFDVSKYFTDRLKIDLWKWRKPDWAGEEQNYFPKS